MKGLFGFSYIKSSQSKQCSSIYA